jgi:hypothetical protein
MIEKRENETILEAVRPHESLIESMKINVSRNFIDFPLRIINNYYNKHLFELKFFE